MSVVLQKAGILGITINSVNNLNIKNGKENLSKKLLHFLAHYDDWESRRLLIIKQSALKHCCTQHKLQQVTGHWAVVPEFAESFAWNMNTERWPKSGYTESWRRKEERMAGAVHSITKESYVTLYITIHKFNKVQSSLTFIHNVYFYVAA